MTVVFKATPDIPFTYNVPLYPEVSAAEYEVPLTYNTSLLYVKGMYSPGAAMSTEIVPLLEKSAKPELLLKPLGLTTTAS